VALSRHRPRWARSIRDRGGAVLPGRGLAARLAPIAGLLAGLLTWRRRRPG